MIFFNDPIVLFLTNSGTPVSGEKREEESAGAAKPLDERKMYIQSEGRFAKNEQGIWKVKDIPKVYPKCTKSDTCPENERHMHKNEIMKECLHFEKTGAILMKAT